MDFDFERWINATVRSHGLVEAIAEAFSSWSVVAFAVAVAALWFFDAPRRAGVMRRACVTGLAAGGLGMLINQVIAQVWDRPRPYETHPGSIIPLVAPSHDPSFPSDHATAAFAIAFGILFVARRAGLFFLVWAALIAVSRLLVGLHYPGDIVAGAVVGLAAGFAVARFGRPAVDRLVRLASAATDPILARIARPRWIRSTLGSARFRQGTLAVAGGVLLVVFAVRLDGHLVDELPVASLAAWAAVVAVLVRAVGASPAGEAANPGR